MKNQYFHCLSVMILLALLSTTLHAQNDILTKKSTPFDSLQITDVTLTGNQLKRSVTLNIKFKNLYSEKATLHLKFGEFDEFGIADDKGSKYKVHTREDLSGTANINKGFKNIGLVTFGSKKLDYFTYLRQDLNNGEEKTLTVVISGIDPKVQQFSDVHIQSRLLFSGIIKKDGLYHIENTKINWQKTND